MNKQFIAPGWIFGQFALIWTPIDAHPLHNDVSNDLLWQHPMVYVESHALLVEQDYPNNPHGTVHLNSLPNKASFNGLTLAQVLERRSIYGPNDVSWRSTGRHARIMISSRFKKIALLLTLLDGICEVFTTGVLGKFVTQFHNPLILLLLASAFISLLLGQIENCCSISIVH